MLIPKISWTAQFVIGAAVLGYGFGTYSSNLPLSATCISGGLALIITVLVRCINKYG